MDINDLTLGQIKEIQNMSLNLVPVAPSESINFAIGKVVIIRTYSAGVWCGILEQKSGNEVILKDARRMWRWFAEQSISLSAVANYGIKRDKSKIAPSITNVWLEAIEIIPVTEVAKESILGAENAKAE